MQYRPEIDGLRAVAVLPVILFHAGIAPFSGGFVGVDVFFVISGYLITTLIAAEMEEGKFSLLRFYERRARRILPALFLVMAACIPFAWMWMFPSQFEEFALSVVAVVLFVSNILFWSQVGYFAPVAEEQPLLHTWSLAVEEQFYIVFPLLLLVLWRFGRQRMLGFVVVLSLASLWLAEHGARHHPEANFYLIHTRAWELGAGAICALVMRGGPPRPHTLLSLAGLGLILFSVFAYDAATPFPSLYALAPVGGTALIILFAGPATLTGRVLSLPVFVGIGLISYSAYLWHQPLFAFARIRSLDPPSLGLMLALSVLSLGLAYLSWRFVERPFRAGGTRRIGRRAVIGSAATAAALLVGFGAFGYLDDGAPFRLPDKAVALLAYEDDVEATDDVEPCRFNAARGLQAQPVPACSGYMVDGKADVVFIGDSHSAGISPAVQEALKQEGISSYATSYAGCIGLPGFYRVGLPRPEECDKYNRDMIAFAKAHGAKVVVITSRFAAYAEGRGFDNREGGVETRLTLPTELIGTTGRNAWTDPDRKARIVGALRQKVEAVADEIDVVLVYPIPEAGWNVPRRAARMAIAGEGDAFALTTSYDVYRTRNADVVAALDAVERPNVFRVRPDGVLCDAASGRCRNADQDVALYADGNHLSDAGAQLLAPEIVGQIKKAMALGEDWKMAR
ncbi:MAG: acyltransferase 3 [Xanthobacteraceae bacterium]|nr:acyltransferase 3 [Xanthobacteraceae bacterium]